MAVIVSKRIVVPELGKRASDYAVGDTVKLIESGAEVDYLVVHQGLPSGIYDTSCDGTLVLRKDLIETRAWDGGNVNRLESSDIQAWLNGTMLGKYDANTQSAIKQVKIPYRKNGGSGGSDQTGANGLSCKVFLLSGREVGLTSNESSSSPNDGEKLSYFESGNGSSAKQKRIANLNGSATSWWLRSPVTYHANYVFYITPDGGWDFYYVDSSYGVRPALVLSPDTRFDSNTNVIKG